MRQDGENYKRGVKKEQEGKKFLFFGKNLTFFRG